MFCSNCGKPVDDAAKFCVNCGAPLQQVQAAQPAPIPEPPAPPAMTVEQEIAQIEAQQAIPAVITAQNVQQIELLQTQKEAVLHNDIAALQNAIAYFSPYKMLFEEYHRTCQQLNHYARGAKSALLVWGIIATALSGTVMLSCLSDTNTFGTTLSDVLDVLIPLFLLLLLPSLLMLGGGIAMKVANRKKTESYRAAYAKYARELNALYHNFPACPVRPEYADPDTLAKLLHLLQAGRAVDIRDAIFRLADGRRQNRLNEFISITANNTEEINQKEGISCIFAPATFF